MTDVDTRKYYRQRRTLSDSVELDGVGLHTGEEVSVRLEPAESFDGIEFVRTDLDEELRIEPDLDRVVDFPRSTVLGKDGENIHTVEHLLSALWALGVTDVTVRLDGPEIPAMDGSAEPFVTAIEEVGLETLEGDRPIYRVQEPVFVQSGEQSVAIFPSDTFKISCTVSYDDVDLADQFVATTIEPDRFSKEIAPARTYGFEEEVEELRDRDLAQGGSLDNALVIGEDGKYVGDGPRLENEIARHKILDLVGDLSLVGTFFLGHVVGVKSGHDINVNLARKLAEKTEKSPAVVQHKQREIDEEGLDIEDIKGILPHRYPFLLIDRILMIDNDEYFAQGLKNVTINELFFQGHFPDDPVMPGVLVIEALAQLGAAVILNQPENASKNSYFMGVDDVKWRKPVRPGDQLLLESEAVRFRPGAKMGKMKGEAYVDGELAAEGVFKFALVD